MPIEETHKRRRGRNIALAAVLVALILLLYLITLARLGGGS
jgi:hypothetical protein